MQRKTVEISADQSVNVLIKTVYGNSLILKFKFFYEDEGFVHLK